MTPPAHSLLKSDDRTRRRRASEARFRACGLAAIGIAALALAVLLTSVLANGAGAFRQTYIKLQIPLPEASLDKAGQRDPAAMAKVSTFGYAALLHAALLDRIAALQIETELADQDVAAMISKEAAATLRDHVLANPHLIGGMAAMDVLAAGRIDGYFKGRVTLKSAAMDGNTSPQALQLARKLADADVIETRFNWRFLTAPDASDQRPEAAGLGVAMLGSLYMMLVVLALALPVGVAASIYLEEFAPRSRISDLIEVNISNLAAVPSIVFGILGLAVFINFAGMRQSSPLVGGLVLTLMTLPTIIISTRAALKSVPPSIRDAALALGASRMQAVFHHVLPLAAPGILTGTILGLAQALGETAPLLLIGMVAFVRDYPVAYSDTAGLFGDAATALPVQVFNWTQRADPGFAERASGAIITLLVFLAVMNTAAILLRRRFERRW
ncbi:phosphate ABC transporter permease PtsA [Pelagivirga sediminicola]|uniref:Phosphate transport system permease protein PstA n=1 Tax=Pelagivirga sediminicola TaxID=2170575 RepID=A0A2T7G3D2_9RHOB|nr:phosphate ABC transporter permease PstA [Pelagivirga sediminicola]PVA08931.1 phosphate ABC transporter permease PtsA [Pelagivirga sediminicola]